MAIILSVIALVSPSITQAIKGYFDLKLEKIKIYELSKKQALEKFINASQAYTVNNTSDKNYSNYIESVLNLYGYFYIEDTKLIDKLTLSFTKPRSSETFVLLSTLVSDLSKQIRKG